MAVGAVHFHTEIVPALLTSLAVRYPHDRPSLIPPVYNPSERAVKAIPETSHPPLTEPHKREYARRHFEGLP